MKRCAIVGATGYTGQELRRLLTNHCGLEAAVLMTARPGVVPDEADIGPLDLTRLGDVDGVFLCPPHGAAAEVARKALEALGPPVSVGTYLRKISYDAERGLLYAGSRCGVYQVDLDRVAAGASKGTP